MNVSMVRQFHELHPSPWSMVKG